MWASPPLRSRVVLGERPDRDTGEGPLEVATPLLGPQGSLIGCGVGGPSKQREGREAKAERQTLGENGRMIEAPATVVREPGRHPGKDRTFQPPAPHLCGHRVDQRPCGGPVPPQLEIQDESSDRPRVLPPNQQPLERGWGLAVAGRRNLGPA